MKRIRILGFSLRGKDERTKKNWMLEFRNIWRVVKGGKESNEGDHDSRAAIPAGSVGVAINRRGEHKRHEGRHSFIHS